MKRVVLLHPADHVGKWHADGWRTMNVNMATRLSTQEKP